MRQAEPLGEDDAGLRRALIVRLQTGEHQIEMLIAHGVGERAGDDKRVGADRRQPFVLHMNRPIRAARERLAKHLRRACGSRRAHHDLAAVLFAKAQGLLECVRVGLVHLEAGVLLANAPLRLIDPRLPFTGGDLFDANGDSHGVYSLPFTVYVQLSDLFTVTVNGQRTTGEL